MNGGPSTVTRTYATDDTGRIVQVCDPDCASGSIYLVTWNGHGDATGLWRQNADGTLTLANSYTYSTWGRPTTTTHNGYGDLGFRFLYVGGSDVQWDNDFGLGLLYMHARSYSPSLGRFLQPDPARADANLYEYAGNSPITKSDPGGLFPATKPGLTPYTIGKIAEKYVLARLKANGWLIRGEQVAWRWEGRVIRWTDILAEKNGVVQLFEVKANGGFYNALQRARDSLIRLDILEPRYGPERVGTTLVKVAVRGEDDVEITAIRPTGGTISFFGGMIEREGLGGGGRHD